MSGTWPISGLEACDLIKHGYRDRTKLSIVQEINISCVQALLVNINDFRALLIQGTNEALDWLHYNFPLFPREDLGDGQKLCWHGGFLRYAQMVYAFAKYKQTDVVIGHSLGAAAAQIVGISLGVPTIAIASPRPLRDKKKPNHEHLIINLCRKDDLVCNVPFDWLGYGHVGYVHWFKPTHRHLGEDHDIKHYIDILIEQGDPIRSRARA